MDILVVNSGNKKVTAKITEPIQTLIFEATITGDFSEADRVAAFHTHLGQVLLTVSRRVSGKTRDVILQRPLNELLEQMSQFSDDVILIDPNAVVNMKITGRLNIGGLTSIIGNNDLFTEVTLDLGAETDTAITVTGERNHIVRNGNLFYDTLSTLANQDYEFSVEQEMVHVALPDTLTRVLLKHNTNIDVEFTWAELKRKYINNNGITYLDNGVPKFATKWLVIPFMPAELQNEFMGFSTGVKVKTSAQATLYVLKKY